MSGGFLRLRQPRPAHGPRGFVSPRIVRAAALVAAVLLVLPSVAAAQSRREMQMMADIRMLQEQTQLLQQQLDAALARIGETLTTISGRLDQQTEVTRKAFADQKLVVDQLGSDLRVVRERVDETNVRITSLSQEVEALRVSIPQFPATVDPNAPGGSAADTPLAPGVDPATAGAPPAPAAPVAPGISPQRLYDTAWADYTAGQWTLCIEGFNTYLRTFPRSELADEAQYYIGECYFADGKFTEAVDAYTRVAAGYPEGEAVPNAYYKRGIAFDRLGQPDQAKESFEFVIKNYPDSDAARLAKQNLDRLSRGRPGAR
ncbi:MAG: tol-pal system protein YbgF [Vicinamibacterales bacterium]